MKKLLIKNENVNIISPPLDAGIAFKAAKSLIDQGIAKYGEELKIQRNFKEGKGNTKTCISLKRNEDFKKEKTQNNIIIRNELKDKNIEISTGKGEQSENLEEKGKGIETSIKKPEYEIEKQFKHEKIVEDMR